MLSELSIFIQIIFSDKQAESECDPSIDKNNPSQRLKNSYFIMKNFSSES